MEENLAVLIDFENIAAGTEKEGLGRFDVDALMDRLKDKGRILVARSYADWGRFARFKQELLSANITMMELTSHGMQDKNRADIAMVVDCLELAFTREFVHTFVIVSGDSDFTPLVLKMRELNKKVIGVGTRGSTSRLIINACDEFIFYDSVVKAKPKPEPRVERGAARKVTKEHARAFGFLVEVVLGIQREDPFPPLASVVKTAIVRRQPDFSEQDLGFSAFTRFLEAARDAGYVTLQRDQKSGGYRVDTVEDDGADEAPEVPAQPARAAQAESGEVPEDSYYPRGSEPLLAVLAATELSPLAAPTRLALLEALVESVRERNDKRRRVQINFVVEDIKRKLRRTHPDLSPRAVKDVLGALLRANQLMHKDGTPIRSPNASFTLTRTAEQLNRKLAELYLSELKKAGADLRNLSMLAELFFGDPDRRRDVETALAWVSAPTEEEDDLLVVDDVPTAAAPSLDDLLSVDEPAADAAEASEDRDDGRRRRRRRRGGRRDDAAGEGAESAEPHEPIDALDALLSVDRDEEPARPPRRGDSSDAPSRRGGSDAPSRRGGSDAPPRRGSSDEPSRRGSSDAPSRRGGSDEPSRRGSSDEPSRRGSSDEPSRRGGSDAPRRGGSVSRDGVATFS
ncbi:MAG TPA: NYN domain-containing protein, partial [Myxococcota bacterium]|nr:NYN domain-containing protein [Myxococcota bacterium]